MRDAINRILGWITGQGDHLETPPALNCRKGDVAILLCEGAWVEHVLTLERHYIVRAGAFVECGDPVSVNGKPGWKLVDPIHFDIRFSTGEKVSGRVPAIADRVLRPIRGRGISDHEVRELFAPGDVPCPALIGQGSEA